MPTGQPIPTVHKQKKRYLTVLKAAEIFCLSDEEAEHLANKAGLSLQQGGRRLEMQKVLEQYNGRQNQLFAASNITERMLYYIKANRNPSKESLTALVISLGMETEEIQQILKTAGYVLSKSLPMDMVVLYFLEHRSEMDREMSLVWQINEVLEELELPLLGTRLYGKGEILWGKP